MPYYVNKTDGTAILVLDGTKDTTSTSLTLLGRLSTNYGENQNENFVRLLENFANDTSPSNPITGQIWFDTSTNVLKVYIDSIWQAITENLTGNIVSSGNLIIGSNQFEIQETNGNVRLINKYNNGNISFISNVAGTLTNVLNINSSTGLITVTGNATNSLGVVTKSYVDNNVDKLNANVTILQTNVSTLQTNINTVANSVTSFSSGTGSVNSKDLALNGNVVLQNSGSGNVAIDLKTPGGVTLISAQGSSSGATPVTILGQWSLGTGATLNANYADLAEYFNSDSYYEPGTVLIFGENATLTTTNLENDTKVAGVVTTNPAFVLNNFLEGTRCCIALKGRVPCKVIGPIMPGDMITTSEKPGYAKKAINPTVGSIIGKSLSKLAHDEQGIIEILAGQH